METKPITWPARFRLGESIDCLDEVWFADIILMAEAKDDPDDTEDVAICHLGMFNSEDAASRAVATVRRLTTPALRKLEWYPA